MYIKQYQCIVCLYKIWLTSLVKLQVIVFTICYISLTLPCSFINYLQGKLFLNKVRLYIPFFIVVLFLRCITICYFIRWWEFLSSIQCDMIFSDMNFQWYCKYFLYCYSCRVIIVGHYNNFTNPTMIDIFVMCH